MSVETNYQQLPGIFLDTASLQIKQESIDPRAVTLWKVHRSILKQQADIRIFFTPIVDKSKGPRISRKTTL